MEIGATSSSTQLATLQRELKADQKVLTEHQRAGAKAAVIAADQARILQDQLAISAATSASGSLDVLA